MLTQIDTIDVVDQTIPGANFTQWDWDAFWEAWNNQDKYIREQRGQ